MLCEFCFVVYCVYLYVVGDGCYVVLYVWDVVDFDEVVEVYVYYVEWVVWCVVYGVCVVCG